MLGYPLSILSRDARPIETRPYLHFFRPDRIAQGLFAESRIAWSTLLSTESSAPHSIRLTYKGVYGNSPLSRAKTIPFPSSHRSLSYQKCSSIQKEYRSPIFAMQVRFSTDPAADRPISRGNS